MSTEQIETVSTETETVETAIAVPVTTTTVEGTITAKLTYTKKEDMQRGNDAILAALPTEGEGFNKAQIIAALSEDIRPLVEHNWNLRIRLLEETEQVRTQGNKVAKRYWRA